MRLDLRRGGGGRRHRRGRVRHRAGGRRALGMPWSSPPPRTQTSSAASGWRPWGGAHAQAVGLYDHLVAAGGHSVARGTSDFDETIEPDGGGGAARSTSPRLLPDLPEAAHAAPPRGLPGARRRRRPRPAQRSTGAPATSRSTPIGSSTCSVDGQALELTGRMVIGADGRTSGVRRSLGIELERYEAGHFLGGVLVDGLEFLGDDAVQYIATEAGIHALCFPQGGGRARLYIAYGRRRPASASPAPTGAARTSTPSRWSAGRRRAPRAVPLRHACRAGQGLPEHRHLVRPPLRRWRRAGRGRRGAQRPDHRAGALHRDGGRPRRHRCPARHRRLVTGDLRGVRAGAPRTDATAPGRGPALRGSVIGGQSWARYRRRGRLATAMAEMLTATSVVGPCCPPGRDVQRGVPRAVARRTRLSHSRHAPAPDEVGRLHPSSPG